MEDYQQYYDFHQNTTMNKQSWKDKLGFFYGIGVSDQQRPGTRDTRGVTSAMLAF